MQPALLVPQPSTPPGGDVQFALCDVSTREGVGRAYTYAQLSANEQGEVVPPKEILLWRSGTVKTTKGNFLFDDKARDIIWADWQERMGGVVSPSGDPPGSFDYDHDEWNEKMPGWQKLSAGCFDLGKDGKDFWLVNCWYTDLCAELIRTKQKRSTSPAFDFDPKTGRLLRLYNVAITNVPATHKQALLASMGVKGELYLPPSTEPELPPAVAEPARTLIQVPITLSLPAPLKDADLAQLTAQIAAAVQAAQPAAAPAVTASAPSEPAPVVAAAPRPRAVTGVVPYAEYPLDETETWDQAAALKRVKAWATTDGELDLSRYGSAFGYVASEGEKLEDYELLHHDVKDGELVTVLGGVLACCDAVESDEIEIPEQDLAAVKEHLAKHCKEFGRRAPWDAESESAAARPQPPTPAPAPVPAATTRSDGMSTYFDYYSDEELTMFCIGEHVEILFLCTALSRKAPEEHRAMFGEMVKATVKHMTELATFAAKIGLPEMAQGEMASITAEELASIEDPEVKTVLTSIGKLKAQRSLPALSAVMAQLSVESPAALRPAIMNMQALAAEKQAEAERATQIASTTTIAVQRRAKIAELQEQNLCSAAQAQEMEGLDPVTGKPKMVKLSAGSAAMPAKPWTLGEILEYERNAKERLSGQKPQVTASIPGVSTSAPPPPAGSAAPPPALPAAGDPNAAPPTEDEIEFIIAGVRAGGGECTRERAIEMLKANRAGKFGPDTVTSSST